MSPTRSGTLFGIAAYAAWGSFPLFFPLLEPAGALEVLAHRVVWSLLVVGALLALGVASARGLRRDQLLRLAAAAVLLAVNWGTYIYGVNSEQVVETSLGYFINPLVSVALGVVVLGERLRPVQQLAVGIAFVAVLVLTLEAGHPPVIALVLAFSFGTYGLLKKQAGVGAVASLAVETAVLTPAALVYLVAIGITGDGTFTTEGLGHSLLLVSAGIVTAGPLLAFGAAATRIPLSTLGVLQYIAPTLQLVCGLVVAHEAFGVPQAVGFGLVWVALVLFTSDLVRSHRAAQRAVLVPA